MSYLQSLKISTKDFYNSIKIYTHLKPVETIKIKHFLDNCNLPSLNVAEREELGAQIAVKDIEETIKSLNNGKTPGPDGFSDKFY